MADLDGITAEQIMHGITRALLVALAGPLTDATHDTEETNHG